MTELQKKALSSIKRLNLRGVLGTKFGMSFDRNGFAVCPFHKENKPSFHVWQGENGNWRWRCFGCGKSGDYIDFRQHSDNVNFHDALRLICSEEHVDLDAGYSATRQANSAVTFTYTDAKGKPLYRLKKSPPKQFYFERYAQGQWLPGLNGVNRTLYNLPALLDAKEVFLLEGEKDCETLRKLSFVATTMGSKNSWRKDFSSFFKDKNVRVCLDVGNETEAEQIARDIEAVATSVRILRLPDLDQKEQDITDWFENMAGQSDEEKAEVLRQVVKATPIRSKPSSSTSVPLAETILEFKARSIPERDIFMKYWLEREGLTYLGGENKTGKSVIAMDVALSLALGKDFLGFEVQLPRRVLLVQQEISDSAMQDRIDKMFIGLSKDSLQNLIVPRRPDRRWKLTREKDREQLGQMVRDYRIDLVILDPISTFHNLRENDSSDMSTLSDYLADMMKKHRIGIFVIHHHGKSTQFERQGSQKLRGSSVLGDRADAIITSIRLPEKYKQTSLPKPFVNYAQLQFTLRNDEGPEDIVIERDSDTLWYSLYELPGYMGRKIPPTRVADFVKEHGGSISQAEVQKGLEKSASHRIVFEAIKEAKALGRIVAVQSPGKGSPLMLVLPEMVQVRRGAQEGVA